LRLELDPVLPRNAQLSNNLAKEPHADISAFVHEDRDNLARLGMNHSGMFAFGERADEPEFSELT